MEIINEEMVEEMLLAEISKKIMDGLQEIFHEIIECTH